MKAGPGSTIITIPATRMIPPTENTIIRHQIDERRSLVDDVDLAMCSASRNWMKVLEHKRQCNQQRKNKEHRMEGETQAHEQRE
jgi:hypothetical protein